MVQEVDFLFFYAILNSKKKGILTTPPLWRKI